MPRALQSWLDENLSDDATHSCYAVQEDFTFGLTMELSRFYAFPQIHIKQRNRGWFRCHLQLTCVHLPLKNGKMEFGSKGSRVDEQFFPLETTSLMCVCFFILRTLQFSPPTDALQIAVNHKKFCVGGVFSTGFISWESCYFQVFNIYIFR